MGRPDYIVDIQGLNPSRQGRHVSASQSGGSLRGRPWLAVHWKCCRVYNRIYRTADGSRYEGACPKCGRRTRARVGPDGVSARFFETK